MSQNIPALTLPATQTRMINASEGLRLEVQSGCLWLTRPSDTVDRFLMAGSSIELHENQVLIQSDRHPGATGLEATRYRLTPIKTPAVEIRAINALSTKTQAPLQDKQAPKQIGNVALGWFREYFFTQKQRLT